MTKQHGIARVGLPRDHSRAHQELRTENWPVAPVDSWAGTGVHNRGGRQRFDLVCNWRDLAHPHAGGAEVYAHEVAAAWVAAGHQVTCSCAAVADRPSMDHVDRNTVVRRGSRHSVYRQARLFYQHQRRGRFDLVVDEVNARPFEAARWASATPVVALACQVAREVWFRELAWLVALAGRFLLKPRWLRQLRSVLVLTISESSRRSPVAAVSMQAGGRPSPVVAGVSAGDVAGLPVGTSRQRPAWIR